MDGSVREKVEFFVREKMQHNDPSHDWLHVERVRSRALALANRLNGILLAGNWRADQILSPNYLALLPVVGEGGFPVNINLTIVELSALLHDVADPKYYSGSLDQSQSMIRDVLSPQVCMEEQEKILFIINGISFRKELESPNTFSDLLNLHDLPLALAFACVQDADRLDALGAIGIARCFAYGSIFGTPFYSSEQPKELITFEEYVGKDTNSSSINHFHEKLLKLHSLVKTAPGFVAAKERTETMKFFVQKFSSEISSNE
ncbi:hypothetical protein MDAP_000264 [Mitosporidium daphniae]|uniref:HD/PDEase domain-containing protein n=1 Tax=Mitosporidium daphniae TaxID=1485682 RepID=A0A098VUX1_9MICR|nr:uncharacterized protein DI09_12p360 [Mitosporidium daphniae]KGG52868.1 hypothetical protein DI09_12p360 [Mitosporidium daphniae]|eukprot:XP_013239295.1 uncharacterized protein DI09_12p360 [Mitosporidium daphniae]